MKTSEILRAVKPCLDDRQGYLSSKTTNYFDTLKRLVKDGSITFLQFPMEIYFELTNKCNLRCKYCYKRACNASDESFVDPDIIKRLLENAKNEGYFFNAILEGGEPLLHPNFFEIYESLKSGGIPVDLITNGLGITKEFIKVFSQLYTAGFDEIQISLDGLGKLNYLNRGIDSRNVLNGLGNLNSFGIVPRINCVVTNMNVKGVINLIHHLSEGFSISSFSLCCPIGRSFKQYLASDTDTVSLLDELNGIRNSVSFPIVGLPIDTECEYSASQSDERKAVRCTALKAKACISASGDVYPCVFLENRMPPLGNVQTRTLYDIWHSEESHNYRQRSSNEVKRCSTCEHAGYCSQNCAGGML